MDGDGSVGNGSDALNHFGWFATDSAATDHNGNGITDMEDVLDYRLYLGYDCPIPPMPDVDLFSNLVMEIYHLHTDSLISGPDTIPAGAITYRVYAQMLDPNASIGAIYGTLEHPLTLTTNTTFWSSTFGTSEGLANSQILLVETLSEAIYYDSYFSFGEDQTADYFNAQYTSFFGNPEALDVRAVLDGGNTLNFGHAAGGGWINTTPFDPSTTTDILLIGQFTVLDGGSLEGQLNLEVFDSPISSSNQGHHRSHALTFSSENLTETGCTDPLAENYDPAALIDNGTCTYFGDVTGDGEVDFDDLLELIGNFGCTGCGDLDLDGDGVVGMADLLLFLGLI